MSVGYNNQVNSDSNTLEHDSVQNSKKELEIDKLTGLYHRNKLDEMFETEYKTFRFCGVMVLDINDLHKLNKNEGFDEYMSNIIKERLKNGSIH